VRYGARMIVGAVQSKRNSKRDLPDAAPSGSPYTVHSCATALRTLPRALRAATRAEGQLETNDLDPRRQRTHQLLTPQRRRFTH
jgi:hypothetical protein